MRIEQQTQQTVGLVLSADKARHVLGGLQAHAEELGEVGAALASALRAAGLTPPQAPAHARTEWP